MIRLLPLLLLAGCASSPEFTAIIGPRWSEGSRDTAATFMLMQRYGKHGISGCVHNSLPSRGAPFNREPEVTFDHCGTGFRVGGQTRR